MISVSERTNEGLVVRFVCAYSDSSWPTMRSCYHEMRGRFGKRVVHSLCVQAKRYMRARRLWLAAVEKRDWAGTNRPYNLMADYMYQIKRLIDQVAS